MVKACGAPDGCPEAGNPQLVAVCILTVVRTLLATISSYQCLSSPRCLKGALIFSLVTDISSLLPKGYFDIFTYLFLFHSLCFHKPGRSGIAGSGAATLNQTQGPSRLRLHL